MKTNQLKRVILLAALVLSGTFLFAKESFNVSGKIINSNKQEVCNATIYLLDSKTKEIVGYGVCNNSGQFEIEDIEIGDYILSVSKEGFKKVTIKYISIDKFGKLNDKTTFVLKSNPDLRDQTDTTEI